MRIFRRPAGYICVIFISIMSFLSFDNSMKESHPFFEDFLFFNGERWEVNLNSFHECGSEMVKEAISFHNSFMTIRLNKNNSFNYRKPYEGGEMGSFQFFNYGKFTVRMKNNISAGTVSSFFLMNQWQEKNWTHKEIDIEFLGKDPSMAMFTVHLYANGGKNHLFYTHYHPLGFDSSQDFHEYAIRWRKQGIEWYVDNQLVHTEKRIIPDTLLQIRMNHWCANPLHPETYFWMGPLDEKALPSTVSYDWIKYEPE